MAQRKCRHDPQDIWTGRFPSEHLRARPFYDVCLKVIFLQLEGRFDREHDFFVSREAGIILIGNSGSDEKTGFAIAIPSNERGVLFVLLCC